MNSASLNSSTVDRVPNKPKTPIMNFRVPKELADAARAKAATKGESVTQVVIRALERYVKAK